MRRTPALAFTIIGVVFLTIGVSGQRSFMVLGTIFVAIGLVFLLRQRRAGRAR